MPRVNLVTVLPFPLTSSFVKPLALCAAACSLFVTACEKPPVRQETANLDTVKTAARDAYVYGYPLLIMDATEAKMTNVPHPTGKAAPVNQFFHMKTYPDASFVDVVSPNADTLYSSGWLNLEKEPIVLSLPDTHGRYYLMPMLDAWTNVFASPGKRTTGTGRGDFAITGPGWQGTLPSGVKEIKAPTNTVWIIGRIQANGKSDYSAVNALQAKVKLTPLSAWGKPYEPPADVPVRSDVDMKAAPADVVEKMDAAAYFGRLAALMKTNPPAAADAPMLTTLATLGILPGEQFDLNKNGSETAKAIADGVEEGKKSVIELGHNPGNVEVKNGWIVATSSMGSYGTNYSARAGIAWVGLGANLMADAVYPMVRVDADGQPLNGTNNYSIHFEKGQTPPANAFWSLTMYNDKQLFIDNPINRYAIGDRDKLKMNPDGSLDILIQHDSPGRAKESNWLPAPIGSFNVIMRMYWPKEQILNGTWAPPAIKRVS
jgi:hypothetical protein